MDKSIEKVDPVEKAEAVIEIKVEARTAKNAPAAEPRYTIAELMAAASAFKVPSECIAAALKSQGKTSATEAEAKDLIKKFMTKEVK